MKKLLTILCGLAGCALAHAANPSFTEMNLVSNQMRTADALLSNSLNARLNATNGRAVNLTVVSNLALIGATPQLQIFSYDTLTNDSVYLDYGVYSGSTNFASVVEIYGTNWPGAFIISSNGSIAPFNSPGGLLGDNVYSFHGGYLDGLHPFTVLGTMNFSNLVTLKAVTNGHVATTDGSGNITFQPASDAGVPIISNLFTFLKTNSSAAAATNLDCSTNTGFRLIVTNNIRYRFTNLTRGDTDWKTVNIELISKSNFNVGFDDQSGVTSPSNAPFPTNFILSTNVLSFIKFGTNAVRAFGSTNFN